MAKFTVEFNEDNDFDELVLVVNRKTVLCLINAYLNGSITEETFKEVIQKYI